MSRLKNLSFNPALEFALVFGLSLGILYLICRQAIGLPSFGDETQAYIPYAYSIYLHGIPGAEVCMHCIGLIHPPFYYAIIALFAKTLGWSLPLLRWTSLIFTALTTTGVYALCRLKSSVVLALSATFFCLATHRIIAESVALTPDVPAGAIALWSFYFLFKKRTQIAVILISLGALTNTPFLFLMPAFVYAFPGSFKKKTLSLFVPFVLFLCWVLVFQAIWGNSGILSNFGVVANLGWIKNPDFLSLIFRAKVRTIQIFFEDFRWVLTTLFFLALLLPSWRRRQTERDTLLLALFCQWIGTAIFGLLLFRYLLFSFSALTVIGAYAISSSRHFRTQLQLAGSVLLFWIAYVSYSLFIPNQWSGVETIYALIQKLPQDPKTLVVCDSFLFADALRFPEAGYVSSARNAVDLNLRPQDAITKIMETPLKNLVYLEYQATPQMQIQLPGGRTAQLSHCLTQTGKYNAMARLCRIDSIR